MNREIIVATKNKGKAEEFSHWFSKAGIRIKSLNDFPGAPDIVEDGLTFAENALKKARTIAEAFGFPVLADDSGLCVDELDGEPGVYSARYAGPEANDRQNNLKLLAELAAKRRPDKPGRQPHDAPVPVHGVELLSPARFVCALALYFPDRREAVQAEGKLEGYIVSEPKGEYGFGYDPLFYLPEFGKTLAELPLERKNALSHRTKALEALWERLEQDQVLPRF